LTLLSAGLPSVFCLRRQAGNDFLIWQGNSSRFPVNKKTLGAGFFLYLEKERIFMKRKWQKKAAAGLAAGMAVTVTAVNVLAAAPEENSNEISKEETVYVNADPTGTAKEITVSEWLKNAGISAPIQDTTELKGIKNVKGDETFTQKGKEISWDAKNADIYYEGTSSKELPVSVKFTYYLNGKEMSPQEIAGKSGRVQIKVTYKNNQKKKVKENGKEKEVYSPFVMATGIILPVDQFTNIEVDHGKIISDASRNIIVGFALPGMKESLQISNTEDDAKKDSKDEDLWKDVEIPEEFTISADVTDFSLDNTFTMALNDMFQDLELDPQSAVDGLQDSLKELEDNSKKLVDGAAKVSDGAKTLNSKYGEFAAGIQTLSQGISSLGSGSSTLSDGIEEYTGGADTLAAGVHSYVEGAGTLTEGIKAYTEGGKTLAQGVKAYVEGTDTYVNGTSQYVAGVEQLSGGIHTLADQTAALPDQTASLSSGLQTAKVAIDQAAAGGEAVAGQMGTVSSQMQELSGQLTGAGDMVSGMQSTLTGVGSQVSAAAGALSGIDMESLDENTRNAILSALGNLQGAGDGLGQIQESAGGLVQMGSLAGDLAQGAQALSQGAESLASGMSQLGELQEGMDTLAQGGEALAQGAQALTAGVGSLKDGVDQLTSQNQTLLDGGKQLTASGSQLTEGADTLEKSSGQLTDGVSQLESAGSQLTSGADTLSANSSTLRQGAASLISGAGQLTDGAGTLKNGSIQLASGISDLASGALELKNGTSKFHKEGIQKIGDTLDEKLEDALGQWKAIGAEDAKYESYGGRPASMPGSVKFIISTDPIQTPDEE
jgi:putative membrane protein